MTQLSTPLQFSTVYSEDERGNFSKPFALPAPFGDEYDIREIFWSTSAKGVIRGMHFQLPPAGIAKVVWASSGSAIDVVVDLRRGPTYGAVTSYPIDATSGTAVWVPVGFAHGFQALEDGTVVNYAVDGDFSAEHDAGVRWDSVGFDWPLPPTVVSPRDQAQRALADFVSPWSAD